MRLLDLRRLRTRLIVFGLLSVGFMAFLFAAEQIAPTRTEPTVWVLVAGILGGAALGSLLRWRSAARDADQIDWQPALLLRVLAGGLSFQAGLIGYFVSGDLPAAVLGCVLFLAVIVVAALLLPTLTFAESDA